MNDHFREGKFGLLGGYLLGMSDCEIEFFERSAWASWCLATRQRAQCMAAVVASKLALSMLIVSSRIRRSFRP